MKKLKKLTREQKIYLGEKGLNAKEYLLERKDDKTYTFYNIKKGLLETMER